MTTIMDPTDERVPVARQITPRAGAVTGSVALLDISKPRGAVLLDRLEALLKDRADKQKLDANRMIKQIGKDVARKDTS